MPAPSSSPHRPLAACLALAAALLAPLPSHAASPPFLELGPMLGHVGPHSASVWIKGSAPARASLVVARDPDLATPTPPRDLSHADLGADPDHIATLHADGLDPDTRYHYAIALDGELVTPRPFPAFTTAPPPDARGRTRFAFTSCLGKSGADAAAAWAQLDTLADLDLVLLLGDGHYADSTARAAQAPAYFSHRATAGFRSASSRLPIYSIWDDHDYGPNDSDGGARGKQESLQTFRAFWPNPAAGEPHNPGIYCRFGRAGIDFFLLDGRYHRSPNQQLADGSKTMLGARQLEWLKRGLAASTAPVKVVACGSEWQRHGHTDSWTSFPRERDDLFDFIAAEQITGVLLLSGDRHFSAGYHIGGKLVEITAGPMGSRNYPTKNLPDMFFKHNQGKLFCVLDIDTAAETPSIHVETHRAGDGLLQRLAIPWHAVLGQQPLPFLKVETVPEKKPFQLPPPPPPAPTPAPNPNANANAKAKAKAPDATPTPRQPDTDSPTR